MWYPGFAKYASKVFGLLYPHVSFLLSRNSVVWFLPRISQLSLTKEGIRLSCGWYVVMRKTLSCYPPRFVCCVCVGSNMLSQALPNQKPISQLALPALQQILRQQQEPKECPQRNTASLFVTSGDANSADSWTPRQIWHHFVRKHNKSTTA